MRVCGAAHLASRRRHTVRSSSRCAQSASTTTSSSSSFRSSVCSTSPTASRPRSASSRTRSLRAARSRDRETRSCAVARGAGATSRTDPTECRHDACRSRRHRYRCARGGAWSAQLRGGGAVDVAIAAALAAMCTEPGVVSLMGGAFVNVWHVGQEPVVIDGNVEMPGRGLPRSAFGHGVREVRADYGGGVTMGAGHGSVANSGAVQALSVARDRYGVLPWRHLVEPSARICREGYRVGAAAALYLGIVRDSLFGADPEAHALVTGADGGAIQPGETSTNDDLADILDLLAVQGAPLFTTGAVGRVLVEEMAANGGLITAADLEAYEPVGAAPRPCRVVGDWTVALTRHPPSAVPCSPSCSASSPVVDHTRGSTSSTSSAACSPTVSPCTTGRHDLDADGHALLAAVEHHGLVGLPTSASTAPHLCGRRAGNACAITMSSGYGAGMVVPGTGILLNNALGEPELNRLGFTRSRRARGLPPTWLRPRRAPAPARSRQSARREPTASRPLSCRCSATPCSAGRASRPPSTSLALTCGSCRAGPPRRPRAVRGHQRAVDELGLASSGFPGPHMYFGGVGAAQLGPEGLLAAGDARREAAVGISP